MGVVLDTTHTVSKVHNNFSIANKYGSLPKSPFKFQTRRSTVLLPLRGKEHVGRQHNVVPGPDAPNRASSRPWPSLQRPPGHGFYEAVESSMPAAFCFYIAPRLSNYRLALDSPRSSPRSRTNLFFSLSLSLSRAARRAA
jgi:hypothetical protein